MMIVPLADMTAKLSAYPGDGDSRFPIRSAARLESLEPGRTGPGPAVLVRPPRTNASRPSDPVLVRLRVLRG